MIRIVAAISLLLALVACSKHEPAATGASGHHHHAPHGGVLVELGDHQFNLELKFDEKRGILQVWVLDGHAENFVRIAQRGFEMEARAGTTARVLDFVAVADTMTGETVGDTSLFEVEAEWLRAAKAFDGRLKAITVRGNTYRDIIVRFNEHESHSH